MVGGVFILDDDEDLRRSLGEFLVLGSDQRFVDAGSFDGMLARAHDVLSCTLALLDINLGVDQPSGIDAYLWLTRERFAGRIVFVTGHGRSHPLVQEAHQLGHVSILEKPVHPDQLLALFRGRENQS